MSEGVIAFELYYSKGITLKLYHATLYHTITYIVSIIAGVIMVLLFVSELNFYLATEVLYCIACMYVL